MANVIITGSSKGIGLGLAREFSSRGHNVVISGRTEGSLIAARAHIGEVKGGVIAKTCEVKDPAEVQALWDAAVAAFGSVDIWINNAGLARTVWSIIDTPDSDIHSMISTNMLGTINGSKVAARGMLDQGQGKIFNMLGGGSDGEYFPGMGIYGTTKRGLNYFTDALVRELKTSPILINKIRPGVIITDAVIREARENLEYFQKSRTQMNNLVDTIETVSPFLVDQILATTKSGGKIRWLNSAKISGRMLKGLFIKREDQFTPFGL